jgi:hypothetical protein
VKALTYFLSTLLWIKHPGTRLPWWLMTQMLGMPARQHDNPVIVFVLPEIYNRRVIQYGPSVPVCQSCVRFRAMAWLNLIVLQSKAKVLPHADRRQ